MKSFCVYEHWRPDLQVCFYVGKGTHKRAHSLSRNVRHRRVVEKLRRAGLDVEVRIVADELTESRAFEVEIERIAHWRSVHAHLTNQTDGGDGSSGYRFLPEQREKIKVKATGRVLAPEVRAKMSAAHTGQKRSIETRIKQSAAAKRVQAGRRRRECSHPIERERMAALSRAAANDPEVRRQRSENAKALWADPAYRARVLSARAARRAVIPGFS